MRRSGQRLEQELKEARTSPEKAQAFFNLAVFHDNNSRETEAIPHYRAAIREGLTGPGLAEAHAWLASSLYKTAESKKVLTELCRSREITTDTQLLKFLEGLEGRIYRNMAS